VIPQLGRCDDALLATLAGLPVPVVARTVAEHVAAPEAGALARNRYGLELLVDPETWHNQVSPAARPASYASCGYAYDRAFDPDLETLSPAGERAISVPCSRRRSPPTQRG
jgi:hypothetical protein